MIWFDVFDWKALNKQFKIMQNRSKLCEINQYRSRIGIPEKFDAFEEFPLIFAYEWLAESATHEFNRKNKQNLQKKTFQGNNCVCK